MTKFGYALCLLAITGVLAVDVGRGSDPAQFESARQPQQPVTIRNVSAEPKLRKDLAAESSRISLMLDREASVAVEIHDQWGALVRTIVAGELRTGQHEDVWNGRGEEGTVLDGDWFAYTIQAQDRLGNKAVYDPPASEQGSRVQPREFSFDRETGKISYVLPRPVLVRIRIVLTDGPLLRTLLDWEPQSEGAHTITWDGLDSSRVMRTLGDPKALAVRCRSGERAAPGLGHPAT